MRLAFITATPLEITRGSGTFVGLKTLADALRRMGHAVEIIGPTVHLPVFTAERLLFNVNLRRRSYSEFDLTVGFDMDGFLIASRGRPPHVASIKGVIADEALNESGLTRATMSIQARCEASHVRNASRVITTSRYAADRMEQLYGIPRVDSIVPELIDLSGWRELFHANPAEPDPEKFVVLCVCRFYKRKRLPLLLRAAAQLRDRIPRFEVRLVGGGPELETVLRVRQELRLEGVVTLLGDASQAELAREYNACDIFCLPSIQEGFGIVFLEAMAAGKAIVAARAAAVPETVSQGLLVEPESHEAIAEAIERLYRDSELRRSLAETGLRRVEQFGADHVAALFVEELERVR